MTKVGDTEFVPDFYWHVHHDTLVEWCFDYKGRVRYIRTEKPKDERKLRLRLFQPVKDSFPEELVKVGQAYDVAWRALRAFCGPRRVLRSLDDPGLTLGKARQAYRKALIKHKDTLEALHAKECPNCPWNKHTIFSTA